MPRREERGPAMRELGRMLRQCQLANVRADSRRPWLSWRPSWAVLDRPGRSGIRRRPDRPAGATDRVSGLAGARPARRPAWQGSLCRAWTDHGTAGATVGRPALCPGYPGPAAIGLAGLRENWTDHGTAGPVDGRPGSPGGGPGPCSTVLGIS